MKHEPRHFCLLFGNLTVDRISKNRAAKGLLQMHPYLMGSSRVDDTTQRSPFVGLIAPDDGKVRHRFFPGRRCHHCHLLSIHRMPTNPIGDRSRSCSGNSIGHGDVFLPSLALRKLADQRVIGCIALGSDETTRGVFVETMDNSRSVLPGQTTEFSCTMMKQRVDESTIEISGSGVDNEARRLVHDDDFVVLIENREIDHLTARLIGREAFVREAIRARG